MVKKYVYGSPMETEAVVQRMDQEQGVIPYFKAEEKEDGIIFSYEMNNEDIVYGLGEANRGINKRGWKYESKCTDDPVHSEDKTSLYGAHNFLLIQGKETFGVFFDYPGMVTFDIGYKNSDILTVTPADGSIVVYVIENESLHEIVKEFRQLIGQSYIPPLWAFGYQQSRWSYKTADEIREVVKKHRENNIPLDAVYMDIDYMERYKDFTINEEAFPNFPAFVEEMKKENIHLVPIIDAGVKIEEGYDVYEEGVKKNYFCKREDGTDFVAGVWPGKTHFPDFLNPEARKWFGEKYSFLLNQGIEGFWNDMNEPAIFYTEEGLEEALQAAKDAEGKNLDLDAFFALKDSFINIANNPKDYDRFYHMVNGEKVVHSKVHNLFGYNMTRAAGEAFDTLCPDKRILMFSRSSYIGMHRYGGIWTGDNCAWWSHILLNMKMMPSLNMCGFLYTGADIGGFGNHTTRDLVLRWLAFGIFTPLMRNHAALGTREQEIYQFEKMEEFKNIIDLRYRLIPYLYSEYVKAAVDYSMYFRPLSFDFPEDSMAANVEDQLMLGDGLMVTPVYTQNARGRYVYLPEKMLYIKFTENGKKECKVMEAGHHYIDVALHQVPLFIRKNHILPLCSPVQSTEKISTEKLELIGYMEKGSKASYTLYEDNGYEKDYKKDENYHIITVNASSNGKEVSATVSGKKERKLVLDIYF